MENLSTPKIIYVFFYENMLRIFYHFLNDVFTFKVENFSSKSFRCLAENLIWRKKHFFGEFSFLA